MISADQVVQHIREQLESDDLQALLREIREQLPDSAAAAPPTTIAERLDAARTHQRSLWENPVIGGMARIKRPLYQLLFFIFHRLYWINGDIIEAVSLLHQRTRTLADSQAQLQDSIDRLIALTTPPPDTARLVTEARDIPSLLGADERMLLYSLICALKPSLVVEVSAQPGAAQAVISAALHANAFGRLILVETADQTLPPVPLDERVSIMRGRIADLPAAGVDLALFDDRRDDAADHFRDLAAQMKPDAYMLIHHPNYPAVRDLLDDAISRGQMIDCGLFAAQADAPIGGLRLLRVSR